MASSKTKKKIMNMAYGLGASIVIVGALFKILHLSYGVLTGGLMLGIGLVVEALIFAISAFEPVEEELDWSLVYPELSSGGGGKSSREDALQAKESKSLLSQKLDEMLREAKLDSNMMQSLSNSLLNFKGAAENITPVVDSIATTNKYTEQLSLATSQLESLNSLYKVQLDATNRQSEVLGSTTELKEQMESLSSNLSNLNKVYGGMLSAMSPAR